MTKLAPWQASIVRKAFKLRRELTGKALSKRFGVSVSTIDNYGHDYHPQICKRRRERRE